MIFHIKYEYTINQRNDTQTRFKKTGALPPEGVTLKGRWHSIEGHSGFIIAESQNDESLGKWIQEWSDLLNFEIKPVLTDEQVAKIIG